MKHTRTLIHSTLLRELCTFQLLKWYILPFKLHSNVLENIDGYTLTCTTAILGPGGLGTPQRSEQNHSSLLYVLLLFRSYAGLSSVRMRDAHKQLNFRNEAIVRLCGRWFLSSFPTPN